MKQSVYFIITCLILVGLSSCIPPLKSDSKTQSAFWESFSIGTIVENNEQYLLPGSRQLFGSESGSSEQPFMQKQEEITLQIDPADLPAFLLDVETDIGDAIIESGASIAGRGSGGVTGTSFSISYREENIYGVINIWGSQGKGTDYYLFMIITEGQKNSIQ
ncbi:MAG TPA: hypothetical protein VLA72_04345 [Anaerolineales bacterium]|nr:hypothetical protein [Anaerolineales bacterium]